MIFYISLPFLSLLLIIFQMMIADIVLFGAIGVDLSLVLVIFAGFRLDIVRGGILSFIIGFIRDCLSFSVSGLYTLMYVLVFLISMVVSTRVSSGKLTFIMMFTLICALFEGTAIILLHPLLYGGDISMHALKMNIPQALILSGLSPILFKAFSWSEGFLSGEAKQTAERT
jgi:cell shape-determining protein MreD